jgi:hypothetical protein
MKYMKNYFQCMFLIITMIVITDIDVYKFTKHFNSKISSLKDSILVSTKVENIIL